MSERLSRERLEEIRQGHSGTLCTVCEDTCEYWYACPARDVADLLSHIDALEAENERLRATLAAKEAVQRANEDEMGAEIERLWAVVTDLGDLMSESYGVAGLHKNGDLASWESLRAGGQFESWLQSYDTALDAQEGEA